MNTFQNTKISIIKFGVQNRWYRFCRIALGTSSRIFFWQILFFSIIEFELDHKFLSRQIKFCKYQKFRSHFWVFSNKTKMVDFRSKRMNGDKSWKGIKNIEPDQSEGAKYKFDGHLTKVFLFARMSSGQGPRLRVR